MTIPASAAIDAPKMQRHDPVEEADVGGLDVARLTHHRLLELDGHVRREQEQRAVNHADGSHQAEDEREPGSDDEEQARERETVEQGHDELTRFVDRRSGRRAPREHEHPEQHERADDDGRPGGRCQRTPPSACVALGRGGTRLDQRFSHSPQSPRRHDEVPPRSEYGYPAQVGRCRGAISNDAWEGARTD